MPSNSPIVSVCIPAYHAEGFISHTIQSVLTQTLTNFELIISDDSKDDKTEQAIRQFDDPRIKYSHTSGQIGIDDNWNRAINLSTAPYCKLLCHDDLLYPQCLARQVAILDAPDHLNIALVNCQRDILRATGNIISRKRGMGSTDLNLRAEQAIKRIVRSGTNPIGEPSAVLFRRSAYDKTAGFDDSNLYMIDVDLWAKLLRYGDLYYIAQPLCGFRVSATSLSTQLQKKQVGMVDTFMQKLSTEWPGIINKSDLSRAWWTARGLSIARRIVYTLKQQ